MRLFQRKSLLVSKTDDPRSDRHISLRFPVLVLVIACTAVPAELRYPSAAAFEEFFTPFLADVIANIVGFIPVGIVLANRGSWSAVALATAVSLFVEVSQVFADGRSPSVIDVATNVVGAAIGVVLWRRLRLELHPIRVSKAVALVAALLVVAYVGIGHGITPADVEHAIYLRTVTNPSMLVNDRGTTSAGRLEARWSFDRSDRETASADSRNGPHGTFVNAPKRVDGVDGNAIDLNGRDQWIDVGNPVALRLTGSMSVTAWIKARRFPDDDAAIVSDRTRLGYQLDTTISQERRTVGFKLANDSGRLMARYGRTELATNRWYHVAGVYDAQARTLDVYLNGRPDNGCLLGQVTSRQYVSGAPVFIGRRGDRRGFEFAGLIDDVRIYSRAITSNEIETEVAVHRDLLKPELASHDANTMTTDGAEDACPVGGPNDGQLPGLLVATGVLVGISCVGLWPWRGYRVWALVLSFLTGCLLLLPLATLPLSPFFRWIVPILVLAGGASVIMSRGNEPHAN